MIKILCRVVVMLVLASVLLSACSGGTPGNAILGVQIAQHPAGGTNVNRMSATYTVNYGPVSQTGAADPVDLRIVWVNDKGSRYNEETRTFKIDQGYPSGGTFTTSFSTPQAGAVFDKTFWVVFEWKDSNGTHQLESNKAACTVR